MAAPLGCSLSAGNAKVYHIQNSLTFSVVIVNTNGTFCMYSYLLSLLLSYRCGSVTLFPLPPPHSPTMLSFLRRTLGRRSIRKHAEKSRLREAQRATTHIPAAGDAKSVITCRVSLLDGTDVSVDLPVRRVARTCVYIMPQRGF